MIILLEISPIFIIYLRSDTPSTNGGKEAESNAVLSIERYSTSRGLPSRTCPRDFTNTLSERVPVSSVLEDGLFALFYTNIISKYTYAFNYKTIAIMKSDLPKEYTLLSSSRKIWHTR